MAEQKTRRTTKKPTPKRKTLAPSASVAKAVRAAKPPSPKTRRRTTPPAETPDPHTQRRVQTREMAKWIAGAALDKKAERIEIIDIGEKVDYADYLVLMTGRSDRQVQAIAAGIEDALRARGVRPHGIEGVAQGHWVLLDFSDVIVHVFLEEARRFYDLEGLWMDARRVPFEQSTPGGSTPPTRE